VTLKASCQYGTNRIIRLLENEDGQDLIEYALLTGIIAVAGVLVFGPFRATMTSAYQSWLTNTNAIATPPPPTP
jgi:Flp pilus assembly pilin Flp